MAVTSSWPRATLRRPGYPNPGMRVSDAERSDIADRLARHYGEGRLDMSEFDERVTRAMAAKTIGDFQGLFDDLPDLPGQPGSSIATLAGTAKAQGRPPRVAGNWTPYEEDTQYRTRRQRRRGRRRGPARLVLMAVLAMVAASIAWHAVTTWIMPLIWLALLAAIILVVVKVRHR